MNGSREMTDRNQHSLPEFYRRFFTASDEDHLYRYVAGGQQPQREGVGPGASLTHTYGFTASAGALTLPTIEARLSDLERSTAQRVRETVLEERPLSQEFKEKISIFLLSQERRTPKHRAARDNWSGQLAETRHDEGLLRQIAEQNIRRSSPHADRDDVARRVAALQPRLARFRSTVLQTTAQVPDFLFPHLALKERSPATRVLASMHWCLLKAPGSESFLTSDAPVYRSPQLDLPDSILLYPVSKKFFLKASWDASAVGYVDITGEQTQALNEVTARSAHREVYAGSDDPAIQDLVDRHSRAGALELLKSHSQLE